MGALVGALLLLGLGCNSGVLTTSIEQPEWNEDGSTELIVHIENDARKEKVLDRIDYDGWFTQSAWVVVSDPVETDVFFFQDGNQRSEYNETIESGDSLDVRVMVELVERGEVNGSVSVCFEDEPCQLHEIAFQ